MATIGYRSAVADAFGVKVTGIPAYLMWAFIHVAYLVGWGNRFGILYTWSRALWFSKNRGHRIITFEQAHKQAENDPTPTEEELEHDKHNPAAAALPTQAGDEPATPVSAGERDPG